MAFPGNNPESLERESQIMSLVSSGLSKEQKEQVMASFAGAGN